MNLHRFKVKGWFLLRIILGEFCKNFRRIMGKIISIIGAALTRPIGRVYLKPKEPIGIK